METNESREGRINLEIAINSKDGGKKLEDLILPIQDAIYNLLQSEGTSVTIRVKKGPMPEQGQSTITTANIPEVVLPPSADFEMERGWGGGEFKKRGKIDRRYFLYQLLREEGIDEDIIDTAGIVRPGMMRGESYHLVEIPKVERQVLVCDEEGEATFVSNREMPINFYLENDKKTLMETPGISRVIFRDTEQWRFEMRALLTGKGLLELLEMRRKKMVQLLLPFEPPTPRDENYYSQRETVYHDLCRFAAAAGVDSPLELTTSNLRGVIAVCHNGERVNGVTYIKHAGRALGYADTIKDAASYQADILRNLKEVAGFDLKKSEYTKRDAAYYQNADNVKADLQAFAAEVNIDDIADLTTSYLSGNYVVCSNGERVNCVTYLRHAALALGYGENATGWDTELQKAGRYCPEALRDLKKIAGWVPPAPLPKRDKAYYEDPAKVKADMVEFANSVGVEGIDDLRTTQMSQFRAKCSNGETVTLSRYISNAGVELGIATDSKSANSNAAHILGELKRIAKLTTDAAEDGTTKE